MDFDSDADLDLDFDLEFDIDRIFIASTTSTTYFCILLILVQILFVGWIYDLCLRLDSVISLYCTFLSMVVRDSQKNTGSIKGFFYIFSELQFISIRGSHFQHHRSTRFNLLQEGR